MQGIVFNPHYMAYVDVALTEYWRTIGLKYPDGLAEDGTDIFMVAASQIYRASASFDDEIDVAIRTAYLGTTSFRLVFAIARGSEGLFEGQATYVVADRVTRAPRPLGAMLVSSILAYEPIPPERKPS